MPEREVLLSKIYHINEFNFDSVALELFKYQAKYNEVYAQWLHFLNVNPEKILKIKEIPFLPIQTFKSHKVVTGTGEIQRVFRSSGTTGQIPSQSFVTDISVYHHSCRINFEKFFGDLGQKVWLALLPSYLERDDASLVEMVRYFMDLSQFQDDCGFYLDSKMALKEKIEELADSGREVFLIAVTFALLDWARDGKYRLPSNVHLIETGGMKGRGEELTRAQLHQVLKESFHTDFVYSEYGMTELFSQAYYQKDLLFHPGPGMRILTRSITDPFAILDYGQQGLINVIDLYNIDTCAFIATEDVGRVYSNGTFEVLGRSDNSEIRGCNLMIQ